MGFIDGLIEWHGLTSFNTTHTVPFGTRSQTAALRTSFSVLPDRQLRLRLL